MALDDGGGGLTRSSTVAKCYRLLRAILNTAVEDELIACDMIEATVLPGRGSPPGASAAGLSS